MTHIDVRCQCGVLLRMGVNLVGKVCRCPKCEAEFTVPESRPSKKKATPQTDTSRASAQSEVRETLTQMFSDLVADSPTVASAYALAVHPWPDERVSKRSLEAIAAELMPAKNLVHNDVREIAVDRLLRLSESLRHEGDNDGLANSFERAAEKLEAAHTSQHRQMAPRCWPGRDGPNAMLVDPFGIGVPSDAEVVVGEGNNGGDTSGLEESLAHLMGLSVLSDSADIGCIHGQQPTGVTIEELAQQLGVTLPLEAIDDHIRGLDSRDRDILVSRTFRLKAPDTLEVVAHRWNVSRERVRQIERPLKAAVVEKFRDSVRRLGAASLGPFTGKIVRIDILHSTARKVASSSIWSELATALILEVFGPWRDTKGWAIHESLEDRLRGIRGFLELKADPHGCVPAAAVDESFNGLFMHQDDMQQYAREIVSLGYTCGSWTIRDSMKYQVIAALKSLGQPATKEEVSSLTGIPSKNVRSVFGSLQYVVRTDKSRWGFEEWVARPYDGIPSEIVHRIDRNGGAANVDDLLREIPEQFDVSEVSVQAYLASAAFAVENGLVRRARPEEFEGGRPEDIAGAIKVEGKWGQRVVLRDENLRGFSLGVSVDIAFANGLRPGDRLEVPIVGDDRKASVIWRPHDLNRTVDVGRVAELLQELELVAGSIIVVIPWRESVEILSPEEANGRRTDQESDKVDAEETPGQDSGSNDSSVVDPLLKMLGE